MTADLEESWMVDPNDSHGLVDVENGYIICEFVGTAMATRRTRLASRAPAMARTLLAMARALKKNEWECLWCRETAHGYARIEHGQDCRIAGDLRAAGVEGY